MTRVYLFESDGEALPDSAAKFLPEWRRERWERLRHPNSRQESLSAGLLYAFAMTEWGVSPHRPVTFLQAGKPVFADGDMFFSLSHSGAFSMCAVSTDSVGADVQCQRPVKLSIARRFHPQEQQWLSTLPEEEQEDGFFRLWTRKEAWIKAESGKRVLSLSETDVMSPLQGRYFRDYVLPDNYHAAVCGFEDDITEPVMVKREALLAGLL